MGDCNTCPSATSCSSANTGDCPPEPQLTEAQKASRIGKVIAIMSGKGGVGKSSVTSMLAVSLMHQGYKVGVMDGDITGPSIPKIFGVSGKALVSENGVIPPLTKGMTKLMSLNLLLENEDDPVIWRGSIIAQVINQFWTDVVWGELDYLLIDMPPGTGDVPITVFQSLPVDGIIMVTSPQQLANMVVRKAINMAKKYDATIYGLIENMAYVECGECKHRMEIFGKPKGQEEAEKNGIPYLGELPIDPELARYADEGRIEYYESAAFDKVAIRLLEQIGTDN